jgi:hypothetical protein
MIFFAIFNVFCFWRAIVMDKFGIFNLLNSFFSLNRQKSQSTDNENNKTSLDSILSTLTNSLKNNTPNKEEPPKKQAPFAPLQSSMLSTMSSHDQFIKRVKEKNKT